MIDERLVNVYVDYNPKTRRIFYVGIGSDVRLQSMYRNTIHQQIVEELASKGITFLRKIIYRSITVSKAYRIEMQIIAKCGRIYNNTGYLSNIHHGGKICDNEYRKGKTFIDLFGEERSGIIRAKQSASMKCSKRAQSSIRRNTERRMRGEFTEKETAAHKLTSNRQKNKSMQERLNNPNYVDPRKGKSAKEIYNDPNYEPHNKGKTAEQLYGSDYIDPRSKSFYIQIDDHEPIFCKGDRDFREKFKAHDPLLYKLKENKTHTIKRLKNTTHLFPHNSVVKYICTI